MSEAATRGVLWKKVFRPATGAQVFIAQACNFIKKETLAQVFSCNFRETSKNTFFTEHLWTTASKLCIINQWEMSFCGTHVVLFFKYLRRNKRANQTAVSEFNLCLCLWLNISNYVNLRIQSEFEKIWTRKDIVFGHFSCGACSGWLSRLIKLYLVLKKMNHINDLVHDKNSQATILSG